MGCCSTTQPQTVKDIFEQRFVNKQAILVSGTVNPCHAQGKQSNRLIMAAAWYFAYLVCQVPLETLGSLAIQAAWGEPQLMLMDDSPGSSTATEGHHVQALPSPELPLTLPHLQLTGLHCYQHWAWAVELIPATKPFEHVSKLVLSTCTV